MAEHHYIIKFDDETGEWSQDVDSEEVRFPDGTIWDEAKKEWQYSYQGEGVFYSNADAYDEYLSAVVDTMKFTLDDRGK
jgi:hypothetical protein